MNKSNQLVPGYNSPNLMAVDEVVYRRQVYYTGGGCCPPRRSKSDMNVSSPRCGPCCPQTTLKLSPSVRCSPCNRSLGPPHNTPCSSPYMSPMVGPMNVTSNSTKMSLSVPKVVNRSRSTSSLENSELLSSTRIDSSRNIGYGKADFFMGNGSISRIYKN